uniref:Uncharacterized protein n=1 Tax=Manihot esculenta TaxID=3983 RepID=A0A2C9VPU2_MANES
MRIMTFMEASIQGELRAPGPIDYSLFVYFSSVFSCRHVLFLGLFVPILTSRSVVLITAKWDE